MLLHNFAKDPPARSHFVPALHRTKTNFSINLLTSEHSAERNGIHNVCLEWLRLSLVSCWGLDYILKRREFLNAASLMLSLKVQDPRWDVGVVTLAKSIALGFRGVEYQ